MENLLKKLGDLNISLSQKDGNLDIYDPNDNLNESLLQELKNHKAALIDLLNGSKASSFVEIKKARKQEYYELSSAQKRLFFLYDMDKESLAYNMPQILKLKGYVDVEKLRNAFAALVQRHESLRTVFKLVKQKPYQHVISEVLFEIEYYVKNKEESTESIINWFIRPFELEEEIPFRVGLVKLEEDEYLLMIDMHHIINDGVSQGILIKEFTEIYAGNVLPELSIQYKDYAEWQQSASYLNLKKEQKQFWVDQFKDQPEKLQLPLDFGRPLIKSNKGDKVSFQLDEETLKGLKNTADKAGTTLFMTILSIYNILLAKLSNQEDIVIGTPSAGRQHDDLQGIVGMFVNTLALRNKPSGELNFNTFLKQLSQNTMSCFESQAYQYEELIEDLKIDRVINRNPLFDVMFSYENFDRSVLQIPGASIEECNNDINISKFDLTLIGVERTDSLTLHFEYATDLFEEGTINRFAGCFKNIVEAVVANPEIQISEIAILSEDEKRKLLVEFNDTYSSMPENETLIKLFSEQVKRNPDATALIFEEQNISYKELNDKVEQLAGYLLERKVQKSDLIAVLTGRSPEYVATILAIMKIEATYLPVDHKYPDDRINYILENSKSPFLIGFESILEGRAITYKGTKILLDRDGKQIASAKPYNGIPDGYNKNIYVVYTSGTTGYPKGVMGTEVGLLNRLYWGWKHYNFGKEEICCQKTGLGFADHIAEIFSPLLKGVPLVFIDEDTVRSVEGLATAIDKNNISRIVLVPSLLGALLNIKNRKEASLESLKYVFSSGDTLTVQLANEFYNVFETTRLINVYGSSEVSADVSYYEVPRFRVAHILSYFKNLIHTEKRFRYLGNTDPHELDNDIFTTPDVPLDDIIENFKVSKVSDRPISVDEYYRKLEQDVIPYTVNTAAPTFIGHMTSALPDFVHEISKLISQMNQNLVKIETSKSLTLLEREAIAMLHRVFYDHPNKFYEDNIHTVNTNMGIIASGGTTANISAILAARNKVLFGDAKLKADEKDINVYERLGQLGYKDMVIIGSELMHYSFKKAASLLGLGPKNIKHVPNDKDGVMSIEGLKTVIEDCRKNKLLIIAVVGIAGSTERGSIDPLQEIAKVTRSHNIHFHVDAAWGGALMLSDKYKNLMKGIQEATSITVCGHKQLFLPQGISVCLFKDINYLSYNSVTANYQAQPNTYDFGRFTIEGSRPALSLCLHAALRILGKKGYELLINNGIEKANMFATMINSHEAFELLSCQINILNYRYIPKRYRSMNFGGTFPSEINEEINLMNEKIQQQQFLKGKTFVSKTTIKDANKQPALVFRTVISNPLTKKADFIKVLNDQIDIVEDLFGEKNTYYKEEDNEEIRMVKEYDTTQQKETSVPIGKPLENTQILVLDRFGNLQPKGVPGEICIAGKGLANEYLNNPEETAKAFVHAKVIDGGRIYKTGDIGRWKDDGNLEYLGRKDDQVKVRGFRIELSEIIYHLNTHAQVEESMVIAKQKDNEKYLVAYYIAKEEIGVTSIMDFLSDRLPAYMIPSFFVRLDAFPLNSNGKIDKKLLPDPEIKKDDSYRAPVTETEKKMVNIWSEILKQEQSVIGTETNFFELGGHSLLIMELVNKINKEFDVALTSREVFMKPTIKQQITLIAEGSFFNVSDSTSEAMEKDEVII